jgi:high affinity sulfate transporter 1
MDLGSKPRTSSGIAGWIPAAGWLRSYDSRWLANDLVGGLTASSVVIPQAMAYAAIAGLPLTAGLYTSLVPLIVYALMGTSRPLSVTTTSTIAILTAGALRGVADSGNPDALLVAAATLAALVGTMLLLTCVLRLGVVSNFISEPILTGFKAGIGLVIVVDQIPKMLGIHFDKGHFVHNLVAIADHVPQASVPTIILALALLTLQIGLQKAWPRGPASLCTVVAGVVAFVVLGLDRYGIGRVGEVRGGMPSPDLPDLSLVTELWPAAIGIALMSFVETVAAGKAFLAEDEPAPKPNRELLALSLTNLVGGLFHNMPSGGGTSQTAVNRRAGARTQVAGLVTAAMVVGVLLFLAPLVHDMPQAALAVVVVVPCAGMIKIKEFRAIAGVRPMEFSWALAAFAGVVLVGTLQGIAIAVLLSLLALSYHANRRPVFVLHRKPGTGVFRPQSAEHPDDETFPGLLLLKTEGIVHFANAPRIGDTMMRLIHQHRPRVVVLDCSAIPDFEYTALKMLTDAEARLRKSGVALWLAALNPEPLALIQKSALGKILGRPRMHFNLEGAVRAYQERGATDPTGSIPANQAASQTS